MERPTDEQIDAWYPRMFRSALRLTGDYDVAGELTQQAFCKAISQWHQFDGKALATTWIHRILVNCIRDWRRRMRIRSNEAFDKWVLATATNEEDDPPEYLARQEELAHLRLVVEGLSPTLRRAFVATVLDGHTYGEASDLLSVPVGTIASRVYEARMQIISKMRKRFLGADG